MIDSMMRFMLPSKSMAHCPKLHVARVTMRWLDMLGTATAGAFLFHPTSLYSII